MDPAFWLITLGMLLGVADAVMTPQEDEDDEGNEEEG